MRALKTLCLLLLLAGPAAAGEGLLTVCDDVKDPPTLDPFLEFSEKNHTILQQMLEGLVRLDPDGKVEPALAESWEQADPLRLRFHLRPGVRFHDGSPLTSGDVRFSVERYLDPAVGYPGRGFFASVDHVVAVDSATVDVVTRFPDGVLLRRLAGLITVVPQAYYLKAGAGFGQRPVGTGPFVFDRWEKGRQLDLKANPDYWQKGVPKLERLSFLFLPSEEQLAALKSGRADLVVELPGTATLDVSRNPGTRVMKKDSFYTFAATFNTSRWPLSDKKVRQALNYAVNTRELIRYDLLGNGREVATLSMPGEVGHDPSLKPYPFDPAKARRLLKEAGVKTPLHLKVLLREQGKRTAQIIAKQLQAVGIVLDIQTGTESDLLKSFADKQWDMGMAGMPDPIGHVSFIQNIVLYSRSPYSLFKSTDYDHRLETAITALDGSAQESEGRALDRYVYEEALSLFTYQRIKTYGVSRRAGFTPSVTGMPYFFDARVAR